MKKYCKETNILDNETIKTAMHKCLSGKLKRKDVRKYLLGRDEYNPEKRQEYKEKARTDFEYLDDLISKRAKTLQIEFMRKKLYLKPIKYDQRRDNNSGKLRTIATESIKQQCCDYVAIECLKPFFAYIGEYQIAGLKGRGTSYGIKAIRKWLKDKNCKYAGKCDIKKCYESIDKDKLMTFLRKHIRNPRLLWLIWTLVNTYEQGLSIGSLLSQYLCTLYLAELYHEISERMRHTRRSRDGGVKRIRLVKHVLFQMDDILIIGSNKRHVTEVMQLIRAKLFKMGLRMKQRPQIFKIAVGGMKNEGTFIDIVGYKFFRYNVKICLRKRTFKRLRRCFLRTKRDISGKRNVSIHRARRFVSLYGRLKHTNYYKLKTIYDKVDKVCKGVISCYDKSKICYGTACC